MFFSSTSILSNTCPIFILAPLYLKVYKIIATGIPIAATSIAIPYSVDVTRYNPKSPAPRYLLKHLRNVLFKHPAKGWISPTVNRTTDQTF